jgi:hypothetical protein
MARSRNGKGVLTSVIGDITTATLSIYADYGAFIDLPMLPP